MFKSRADHQLVKGGKLVVQDYQIIIVGGGLGGAAFAKAMAESGTQVLVLEQTRFRHLIRGEVIGRWGVAELRKLGLDGASLRLLSAGDRDSRRPRGERTSGRHSDCGSLPGRSHHARSWQASARAGRRVSTTVWLLTMRFVCTFDLTNVQWLFAEQML